MAYFGCNPYRMTDAGEKVFSQQMKAAAPRIFATSIARLYQQAELSVKARESTEASIIAIHLQHLWQDKERYTKRKEEAKGTMEALYTSLQQQDNRLPMAEKGVISTFHLSRYCDRVLALAQKIFADEHKGGSTGLKQDAVLEAVFFTPSGCIGVVGSESHCHQKIPRSGDVSKGGRNV